ncbi:hypothetical protein AZOA_15700 [Azoarcus sp. Aa7]|nr:hypothetical protein [Azoarcus sp. Aa7]
MPEQQVPHQVGDRLQRLGSTDHPARQGLTWHEDARAREHVLETRQRQTIDVFDDEQQGQQIVAGVALGQHLRGCGGGDRRLVALGAAVALADVTQHPHLHGHDVELFADVLANLDHRGAAGAGALGLGDVVDHIDAGQLDRQGLALAARLLLAGVDGRVVRRLGSRRQRCGVAGLGRGLDQHLGLVEQPPLARVRFTAGPEHAPTCQAQLFVNLEDARLEGFLQFGFTGLEGRLLCGLTGLEGRLPCGLTCLEGCLVLDLTRLESALLRQQQGFEHRRIVRQLRREDERTHAAGGVREGVGGAAWHAAIIPN